MILGKYFYPIISLKKTKKFYKKENEAQSFIYNRPGINHLYIAFITIIQANKFRSQY